MLTSADPVRRRCRGHRRSAITSLAIGAVVILGVTGCSTSSTRSGAPIVIDGSTAASQGMRGDVLDPAVLLTAADNAAVFRSSAGGKTTLGALQRRGLMLVYFGYTHCPDVCPTTMADLGTALRQLPAQVQAKTQVVFITSDPNRDSPSVEKAWLSNFDAGLPRPFVGLTSSLKQIDTVARTVGVPLSPPVTQANGSITVEHGAQTLAFAAGRARVVWLAGTAPADYAHDIYTLALAAS